MLWGVGILVGLVIIGGLALQYAIYHNGPAVLNATDRLTGGSQGAELVATISTGDHAQQQVLVWAPEKQGTTQPDPAAAPLPVLVFAHGGSWQWGNPVDYGFIGRAFVPEGFIVVLVGYRLGEDGKYPAMLEDTARAVAWTHDEIAQYGGDPDRIVLAGHSAGAYNVVMAALEEKWLGEKGVPADAIKGVIGLSGPYDFLPFDSDSTIASFGHVDPPETTQPVEHVRADGPQMLLIHGEDDELVGKHNSANLADRIVAAGGNALYTPMPGLDHNAPLIHHAAPWRRNSEMIELTANFARAVTEEASAGPQTSVPVQAAAR